MSECPFVRYHIACKKLEMCRLHKTDKRTNGHWDWVYERLTIIDNNFFDIRVIGISGYWDFKLSKIFKATIIDNNLTIREYESSNV
jgi:arabinogalactan endo-1,4-beta-galactosidase